jgi:arylsulfatase A-like enzyme
MNRLFSRFLLPFVALALATTTSRAAQPNVLFIIANDLNHWVGHLGRNPQAKTPNIDRLAKAGVTFTKAYCTAPACNPSRASLFSGQRPSTTGCYLNGQEWRPGISEDKLLTSHLRRAGYRLYGSGNIGADERAGSWTDYFAPPAENLTPHSSAKDDGVGGIKFSPVANRDEDMYDYKVASYCADRLKEKHDKPFFLAAGFNKPHMPFSVPKKWFDLFPLETIELPPHRADDLDDVPPAGVRMARPEGDHAQMVQSGRWKEAVQAYLATVAFVDAQAGRVLDALDRSAYRDNTIVVLWSDHGFSLGEKSHWRKFALWEEPTRAPFVWKVPGVTAAGGVCGRAVDYTSIYPTLCPLIGTKTPGHLDGRDISALLKNPRAAWDFPAITTHGFKNHAVRSDGWRYIRYENGDEELYDETADPLEQVNLASRAEHAARKAELAQWLPKVDAPNLPMGGGDEDGGHKTGEKAKRKKK